MRHTSQNTFPLAKARAAYSRWTLPLLVALLSGLTACGSGEPDDAASDHSGNAANVATEKNPFARPPLLNPNPSLPQRAVNASALIGALQDSAPLAGLAETSNGLPGVASQTPGFFSQQTSQLTSNRLTVASHLTRFGSADTERHNSLNLGVSTNMNNALTFNGLGTIASADTTQRLSAAAVSIPNAIYNETRLITYQVPGIPGASVTLTVRPQFRFFEVCWETDFRVDPRMTPTVRDNCSQHDYFDGAAIGLRASGIAESVAYVHQPMRDGNRFRTLLQCQDFRADVPNEYQVITYDPSQAHGGLGNKLPSGNYFIPPTTTESGGVIRMEQTVPFVRYEATIRGTTVTNFRRWAATDTPAGPMWLEWTNCWARNPVDR